MTRISSPSFVRSVAVSFANAVESTVKSTVEDVFVQGPEQGTGGGAGIDQRHPDGIGVALPRGYLPDSFCAPTAVAMVLKMLGAAPQLQTSSALILDIAHQLRTNANGTDATALPGVLHDTYKLDVSQTRYAGHFSLAYRETLTQEGKDALLLEAYRVLGEEPDAGKSPSSVLDRARFANAQGIIEAAAAAGQPVIINGAFDVLHPDEDAATGHYVVLNGVTRDADGQVASYEILDPWTGGASSLDSTQLRAFMEGNALCQLTVVSS